MIPATASSPTRRNVARLARSNSAPAYSLELAPLATRRRASLPSTSHFKPLSPTPILVPQQMPPQRPTFHLAVDSSDPEEDTRTHNPASTDSSDPDTAPPSSVAELESSRRFHALAELLSTELGYLFDLRTLVSVYLRLLPVLKNRSSLPLAHGSSSNSTIGHFARPPSLHGLHSQSASFRTHSHPHLGWNTYPVTLSHPSGPAVPRSSPAKVEKCTVRHLFSASDLDAITRNAEELLELHEILVHQLRQVASHFGIPMSSSEMLENSHRNSLIDVPRAINAVSAVFVDHASSFDQYQSFCSGHSEAFDIVRKVQHRYPAEWDAFELRCAALAVEMQSQEMAEELISSESRKQLADLCQRRHSLSSLDALSSENFKAPNLSASESGHTDRNHSGSRRPRLMFMDYMIKPVQRVCRYPLLFDQLQERTGPQRFNDGLYEPSSTPRDSQDAVKTALWAMRTVARLVDEARRQQDLLAKSVQIVSRITQGLLTSAASHHRPSQSASLSAFLSSLTPCYLSGSLDVIHYRGVNMARLGTVRAKYLGAFLFPGGFLVLVKVAKSKAYEPKHWFNLRGFELVDSNLDDVLLPSWFRLSSKAHMFEFAASCRREKDIWVDAIRRAIVEEVPWSDEPPSSLQIDLTAPLLENVLFETISPLPTIQSIPELDDVESIFPNPGGTALPRPVVQRTSQIRLRVENPAKYDLAAPPVVGPGGRPSVATHPTPMPESNTFHLVRSTASAREQVDRGLLDVFSEKCLTARFHAHTHEEDLFEAQRVSRSFSRSTSALTMASAMSVAAKNRLTKRESVLVPRKKSFIDGNGKLGDGENCMISVIPKPVKRRQHPSKLKIVAMTKSASHEGDEGGSELFLESPSPMSHCSSVSFVTPVTPLTTPAPLSTPSGTTNSLHSNSEPLNVRQNDCVPKRSKSMIENVRGFFAPRSASPTTALNREPSTRSSVSTSSLLRWWSRESLRRRVRSAPDVPTEELPSTLTTRSLHVEAAPRPFLTTADRPYSQPDIHSLYSETAGVSTTEFGVDDPSAQRKGIFSSQCPQRHWAAATLPSKGREEDSTPVPTRIRRNFTFLHRFTLGTRDYDNIIPPS